MANSAGMEILPLSQFAQSVCAVIVTYYPDSRLSDHVRRVASQVAQVVIVDNGSSAPCVQLVRALSDDLSMHLILNPTNQGIASALNAGARWAATQGFRWVLTLDQDSIVSLDMVETLGSVVCSYPRPERLAVVGSNYQDKAHGKIFREQVAGTTGFTGREMESVLTSGSLVSTSAFEALGGFRDEFFIDCVDHEFCLHARARGFHVVLTSKPVMEHGIGNATEHRLLWRTVHTSNHSPVRRYYTTRNALILAREYFFKEPRWTMHHLWGLLKSVILICLFERERAAKMRSIFHGCMHGIAGRTGCLAILAGRN
jgi:rhamnosyltransferase